MRILPIRLLEYFDKNRSSQDIQKNTETESFPDQENQLQLHLVSDEYVGHMATITCN